MTGDVMRYLKLIKTSSIKKNMRQKIAIIMFVSVASIDTMSMPP